MKKLILVATLVTCSIVAFAQSVVVDSTGKVTVVNANDSVLAQLDASGSGAISASFDGAKAEIIVVYSNGNVVVKDPTGTILAQVAMTTNPDKAVAANWSGTNIIITTQSNQTLTKDSNEWRQ